MRLVHRVEGHSDLIKLPFRQLSTKAVIYDFKTNAVRPAETEDAYAARLCETYRAQMTAYRKAVHVLAGIPPESISAKLLLTRTRAVREV